MFNHNRGLWGYTGTGADGGPLTIQSTGMGGPSAADRGRRASPSWARAAWCGLGPAAALDPTLALGELLIAERALAGDGTSRSLGAGEVVDPTPGLLARLTAGADGGVRRCLVATSDLIYEDLERPSAEWLAAGAAAVEMESATLFMLGARRGFEAGAVLIVSDLLIPTRRRIESEQLIAAEERAGALAAAALGLSVSPAWLLALAARGLLGRLEPLERGFDLGQPLFDARGAVGALDAILEAVEAVLDPLQPLGHAAYPPGEALKVAGRREVQRSHGRLLGAEGTLAGLEGR